MNRKIASFHLSALSTAVALVLAMAKGVAAAPDDCAPRDIVVSRLAEGYGETRKEIGLGSSRGGETQVEIFSSGATGSWTITLTDNSGITCMIASGYAFDDLIETLPVRVHDA